MGMGAADLVPGISGGTVAFIVGIYEELIASIKSPFTSWKFLLNVLFGIAVSLVLFSHAIKAILADPVSSRFLFAAFVGFVLGSLYFCARRVGRWGVVEVLLVVFGAVAAFIFSGPVPQGDLLGNEVSFGQFFFSGVFAVCAMLLPGISGSYVLVVLGVYHLVIGSLASFVAGAVSLQIDFAAFQILFFLGLGILTGAVFFSRVIAWLLKNYHSQTLALLCGLMTGALRAVWPFETLVPGLSVISGLLAAVIAASFFVVVFIEYLALRA